MSENLEGQTREVKQERNRNYKAFRNGFGIVVLAAGLFIAGLFVGQGRITFGQNFTSRSRNLPEDLDYSSVETVYDSLRTNYDGELEQEKLLDGLKQGLAEATGDPYTEYLNVEAAQEFKNDLNGTFIGIGAELSKENDAITVVAPISGFPAEKAGLRAKDVISKINGESALDMTVSQAVNKIRGEKGTEVTLTVIREQREELDIKILRDTITIPSVTTEILEGNIGYLKIARFSEDTAALSRKAAQDFKAANVKGVILDMRNDPGGLLDTSIDVASLWLPQGKTVLEEKRGDVVVQTFRAKGNPVLSGVPTVVLINGGSASASEIVAGALKDNGAATLIGEKTFGKGSVQQLTNLRSGAVLKVTIARWYTPAGKNIDKEGITPDKELKPTDDDIKNNRDIQRNAAIEQLKR